MATPAQLEEKARQDRPEVPTIRYHHTPPPLPPRGESVQAPPPYTDDDAKRNQLISEQWHSNDPRSSSTHSLVPSESNRDGRRKLLLIYIHGFLGNETSFQSFPAHVHNLLTITLQETHIIHTKVYPRYKSRKAINFARDDFSNWLEPHEDSLTDIILLGHSMGGILSSEVVLQPPSAPANRLFRHRILGTISFDTPYLGMHPGVVLSGIGSLFRPAPEPPSSRSGSLSPNGASSPSMNGPASTASLADTLSDSNTTYQEIDGQSMTSLAMPPSNDKFYNAPFFNDIRIPERKGFDNFLHFVNKHAEGVGITAKLGGLTSATSQYFVSHIEFGSCLADYPGLMNRYSKIRALEDVDELAGGSNFVNQNQTPRRRFINYYTASTGRPRKPRNSAVEESLHDNASLKAGMSNLSLDHSETQPSTSEESQITTDINLDLANGIHMQQVGEQMQDLGNSSGVQEGAPRSPELRQIDSMPIEEDEPVPIAGLLHAEETESSDTTPQKAPTEPPLPPIPNTPTEPEPMNFDLYTDKDSRKVAEKEHKRIVKAYNQALKDRESALKDRRKLMEKREKKARKDEEKQLKAQGKQRSKEEKEEEKRQATLNSKSSKGKENVPKVEPKMEKPKKDKKFCVLPPESEGQKDACWIRIYMEGVDEIGAHCGLFFPGPQYESLVGDVGERIETWVKEDAAKRAVLSGR
ncbi:hypothetical protein SS1G_00550 [Sclerotinia sclerotiorum 1980 UF-70]|uniref:DUF676 domain-containing protein n=2 Tax=Sclerotinia sclerotiorum (strain ATCC 18683 / 1980 / Ss-1) TaxID=665079 RepID=A7E5H5_SCLS1|nr:hypothetical protein SS1G_00550 [Sclerotinia sclerotiorum 1980 UF-70]APA07848.1 hypothetical protein sscle_03g026180 [Sclerotinia sclerotiorum 1980 UF-70]EDN91147.1 hypothetical protein SS1G_00550 [Sclerotinia sclerotiorum 1980 UF-70]